MTLFTVHTIDKTTNLIKHERRRPNKSSTNAVIVRQSFREEVRKTLSISTFINDYNHYIRDVDLTNQYRTVYEMHKSIRRNWFYILLILLDISIVNSYRISYIVAIQQDTSTKQLLKHTVFRTKLYMYLFSFFNDPIPCDPEYPCNEHPSL